MPRWVVTSDTPSTAAGMASKGAPAAPMLSQPASSKKTINRGRVLRISQQDPRKVNELQIFT
jgi:hypothetical protein